MKKILFMVGSGIGNQCETVPALVRCIREWGKERIVVCNTYPHADHVTPVIFRQMVDEFVSFGNINPEDYDFQIMTYISKIHPVPSVQPKPKQAMIDRISEVEWNMSATGLEWTDDDLGQCGTSMSDIKPFKDAPDVIIHDGYNRTACQPPNRWEAKSYPQWSVVAQQLKEKGYTVGSIGSTPEYVPATENLTNLEFERSVAILKGAKAVLSNDTGSFHVANVLGKPNLVVFTFTSPIKNFDKRFHKNAVLVRRDLPCSPCQFTGKKFWINNREKCKWKCRNIPPEEIVEKTCGLL